MTITLVDVGSGHNRSSINSNFQSIETHINQEILERTGGKALQADMDFNSNDLLNGGNGYFDKLFLNGLEVDSITNGVDLPSQVGNNGKFLRTNGSLASWEAISGPDSVTAMLASSGAVGEQIRTKGYYAKGDGGSALYERTLASAFVGTPDELTDITGVGEGSQWVYKLIDEEGKWKSAAKWGLNATNMADVVAAMKTKLGADNAAMIVPAGDFTTSATIDIDFIGAGSIGQGVITSTSRTIIRPNAVGFPAVTIVKSKQVAKGATVSFFNIIDATTSAIQTETASVGILVSEPPSGQKAHCYIDDISVNNGHAAIDFQDSLFGSYIDIKANYCYCVATGDNHDAQTSLKATFKALGCFNGINVPRIYYSEISAYFDQCGLVPAGSTYVPAGILPIMLDCEAWRGVNMPYMGMEFTVAPIIRSDDYSAVSMNLYFVHGNPTTWTRTFSGTRTTIETYAGTETLAHDDQALFICNTGTVTVRNANIIYNTGFPTAATADTPLVYNNPSALSSDAGVHFDNCNIEHMSYIVKDTAGLSKEDLTYDALTDTICTREDWISQSGNSRIVLNQIDGDGSNLLKRVVSKGHTNDQVEYNFDKYSYSFYKEFTGITAGKFDLAIALNNQGAANIVNKIDVEIIDATDGVATDGKVAVASFYVNSLTTINPAIAANNKILMHECDVASSTNVATITRTTDFSANCIVKVTVTGPNAFWHQNPTTPTSDGGRGNLLIEAANVTIP